MRGTFGHKCFGKSPTKWSQLARKQTKKNCLEKIYDQIYDGLKCFHEAGYVHGDIKEENILYSGLDGDDCPTDIMLADFGLSHKVGKLKAKYDHKWWKLSVHIAETMFKAVRDPLHLTEITRLKNGRKTDAVTMKPVLDWCSLAFLSKSLVPSVATYKRNWARAHAEGLGQAGNGLCRSTAGVSQFVAWRG